MRELLGVVLPMCIPALVYAQDPIVLSRKAGAILLDGAITEEGWHSARPLPPFTMYEPTFGNDPTEASEVLVGYDDYLYVAGRLYDTGTTRAGTLQRNGWAADDEFVVSIDSYNGIGFATTR